MDYRIISIADGRISLTSGDMPSRVVGMDALIQEVLIELVSDVIPSRGRGAGAVQAGNNHVFNEDAFAGDMRQAVSTAQTHILTNQSRVGSLSPEERLASLTLLSAGLVNGNWSLSVLVRNLANQTRELAVPVLA